MCISRIGLRALALALWLALFLPGRGALAQGFAGIFTQHSDNTRTGQNLNETVLTVADVNPSQFGRLFSYAVDGTIYGQPLYVPNVNIPGQDVHNVVYVVTAHDSVYAWDADGASDTPLWQVSFINPDAGITTVPSADTQCDNIFPEVGITGTPVIDPATQTLYVVAVTAEPGGYFSRLHALDLSTGTEKLGGPIIVSPVIPGSGEGSIDGTLSFNALTANQRPGLLLSNGVVYVAYATHCDVGPSHGWVMGFDASTLTPLSVFNTTPNGGLGGIWMSGTGLSADSDGNIYFGAGNDRLCDLGRPADELGDSVLKLGPDLSLLDFFTPFNFLQVCASDLDVGSSGMLLLPDQSGDHPHIMVTATKEARLYVIDRDNLGQFNPDSDSIVQSVPQLFPAPVRSTAAYWNGHIYFGVTNDVLKDFPVTNGLLSTQPAAQDNFPLPYPGSTPSVSANGLSDAIVWIVVGTGLRAHDANDVSQVLYSSDPSDLSDPGGATFAVPTVANGKVYFGTQTQLIVYGLTLPQAP